jgi:hypothetical protein
MDQINRGDFFVFWMSLAIAYWSVCAVRVSIFVRGYFAQRRGIAPAPPPEAPLPSGYALAKWIWRLTGVFACVSAAINLVFTVLRPTARSAQRWVPTLLLFAIFMQQLSMYGRSSFESCKSE